MPAYLSQVGQWTCLHSRDGDGQTGALQMPCPPPKSLAFPLPSFLSTVSSPARPEQAEYSRDDSLERVLAGETAPGTRRLLTCGKGGASPPWGTGLRPSTLPTHTKNVALLVSPGVPGPRPGFSAVESRLGAVLGASEPCRSLQGRLLRRRAGCEPDWQLLGPLFASALSASLALQSPPSGIWTPCLSWCALAEGVQWLEHRGAEPDSCVCRRGGEAKIASSADWGTLPAS